MVEENNQPKVGFDVNEVLEIKGWLFKVTLVDAFTNKICLRRISTEEAARLRAEKARA